MPVRRKSAAVPAAKKKNGNHKPGKPVPSTPDAAWYQAIFAATQDGILLLDDNSRYIDANPAACALTGYTRDELLGLSTADLVPTDVRKIAEDRWQKLLASGTLRDDIRVVRKDGTTIDLDMAATANIAPGIHMACIRDITERKTRSRKLHDELNRFKLATRLGRIGVWDWDVATDKTIWSDEMYRIYGITPQEFTSKGEDYINFTHPDDRQYQQLNIIEAFERAAQRRTLNGSVPRDTPFDPHGFRIIRPDGSICHVMGDAVAIVNQEGISVRMLGVLMDVTDSKEAERKLLHQATLLDHVYDAVIATDPEFRITSWNAAAERIYGWQSSEVMGRVADEVLNTRYLSVETTDTAAEKLAELGYWDGEVLQKHRDGSDIILLASVAQVRSPDGEMLGVIAINHDVTLRRQIEAALQQAQERLQTLIANMPVMLFAINANGIFTLSTGKGVEMLGLRPDEQIGESIFDLFKPYPQAIAAYLQALAGETLITTLEIGPGLILETFLNPVRNAKSEITGVEGFSLDVTERVKIERELARYRDSLEEMVDERTAQLAEANKRLTELDAMKSRFLADVSHEMGHPITTLKVYASLLEQVPAGELPRVARAIGEQSDRLKTFLEDVLSLSRLDFARREIAFERVALNRVVEIAVKSFAPQAEFSGLTLSFEADPDLPEIVGESNQLSQLVSNLISNALRYTKEGSVAVSTAADARRKGVTLSVKDSGTGIGDDDMRHIFERFYRGENASQTPVRGTGLGLSIVKEIVEIHRGRISVESEPGKGSTFTIWLPVTAE
jgi:PAS domain S-box-containing protein